MYTEADVTIIIPHFGADEQQERAFDLCFNSLQKTTSAPILIVRNGETSCNHPADIFLSRQGQNGAVNAAVSITTTAWVFVTNDDMVYARGWMEKLLSTASRYQLPYLCPNLVEPHPGAPPFLVQPFGGAGGDFNEAVWNAFADGHSDKMIEQGFNLPFLIKKDLWDFIGGYDVNYDPWGSNGDSDLQAKILLAGAETMRDRNVVVYHFSQTSGTFHPDNQSFWQHNWNYFKLKWGFERQGNEKDVWYSKRIIDESRLKYKPIWQRGYRKTRTADVDPNYSAWN